MYMYMCMCLIKSDPSQIMTVNAKSQREQILDQILLFANENSLHDLLACSRLPKKPLPEVICSPKH